CVSNTTASTPWLSRNIRQSSASIGRLNRAASTTSLTRACPRPRQSPRVVRLAEDGVAVREAAEPLDDVAVVLGVTELMIVAKLGEQQHRAVLILELLAVHERHVEELAFIRRLLLVETAIDSSLRDCQSVGVSRVGVGVAAEHVARELVEQDDRREGGQGIGEEGVDRQLLHINPQLQEVALDPAVELGAPIPPFLRLEAKPEFENVGAPIAAHAAVPPTVRPSTSRVG